MSLQGSAGTRLFQDGRCNSYPFGAQAEPAEWSACSHAACFEDVVSPSIVARRPRFYVRTSLLEATVVSYDCFSFFGVEGERSHMTGNRPAVTTLLTVQSLNCVFVLNFLKENKKERAFSALMKD